jgi:hypothetical protein
MAGRQESIQEKTIPIRKPGMQEKKEESGKENNQSRKQLSDTSQPPVAFSTQVASITFHRRRALRP